MTRCKLIKSLVLVVGAPVLFLADVSPEAPLGLTLGREAHAFIGRPLTPLSVAGVARRTTRRVVVAEGAAVASTGAQQQAVAQQQAATAQQQAAVAQQQAQAAAQHPAGAPAVGTIVSSLPAGCVQEAKGGVEYQKCGNVYYRSAFQGNNLVYVVQQP